MSRPITFEQSLLVRAEAICAEVGSAFARRGHAARLEILEAAASELGGFSLGEYRRAFPAQYLLQISEARRHGEDLVSTLAEVPIPPALALSALARPPLRFSEQRTRGAYHTDFRLAELLAEMASSHLERARTIVDPACGTGILLVAAIARASHLNGVPTAELLRERVIATDRSAAALRGARLALAALCDDVSALRSMNQRWRVWDSLTTPQRQWAVLAPDGFDVVIANPPWEKIKLSRHEYLTGSGAVRHYGRDYSDQEMDQYQFSKAINSLQTYSAKLDDRYKLLGPGENDLYKPFVELFVYLLRDGGCLSALVPAGLIRSSGTRPLRELLFDRSVELELGVIENRSRFFSIDTRFKFLAVRAVLDRRQAPRGLVTLKHFAGRNGSAPEVIGAAAMSRKALARLRPDLTIPEVRSAREWRLFTDVYRSGIRLEQAPEWRASVARELDMTRDRALFSARCRPGMLPIVEGRMVHQHRFGAKTYVRGSGRRAVWRWAQRGTDTISPQFWMFERELPENIRRRTERARVGFCDITGQTNERSMLASVIPAGVVCGNKVPTLIFDDDRPERMFLWLGIVNSFPFDWMLRRIVTTTVNYFLLFSLPFPGLEITNPIARRIIRAVRELQAVTQRGFSRDNLWKVARLRCEIDVAVATAYRLKYADIELMLKDFPLLDRAQPSLQGECRSTITRDVLLDRCGNIQGYGGKSISERVERARQAGAIPYVPSEAADDLVGSWKDYDG